MKVQGRTSLLGASFKLLWICLFLLFLQLEANAATYLEGSYHQFIGPQDASMVDQPGYSLGVSKSFGNGFIRGNFGMEALSSSGRLRINSSRLSYDMMAGTAALGLSIHPFYGDFLGPLFGASALGGIDVIRTSNPPVGEKLSSEALHRGFEVYGGVDFGRIQDFHVRLKACYRKLLREYGGRSNFYMDSLTFSLSLGFGSGK